MISVILWWFFFKLCTFYVVYIQHQFHVKTEIESRIGIVFKSKSHGGCDAFKWLCFSSCPLTVYVVQGPHFYIQASRYAFEEQREPSGTNLFRMDPIELI